MSGGAGSAGALIPSALVRPEGARPFVYGHRGRRNLPENTLPAFERALDQGADGVELDVRLCKSGEVVVMHDADLRRMAGRAEKIAELDYATLHRIPLGVGAHTPLLAEVLSLVFRRGKCVNVEIKPDVPDLSALVAGVAHELAGRPAQERESVVVSSFEPRALRELHALAPQIAVGYLYDNLRDRDNAPELTGAAYGEHPKHTLLDAALIARMRKRAGFVNSWTVNDPAQALRLAELGVDAIITDFPDVILHALR